MRPRDYCRDLAAPPGSGFYYSTLYHSPDEKRRLNALFAFCREVEETALHSHDASLIRLKLEWWQDQIPRIDSDRVQHPVSAELQALAGQPGSGLEPGQLGCLVEAFLAWLASPPPENYQRWIDSVETGYGEIWRQAAAACGCRAAEDVSVVMRTGALAGAFEQLRQLPHGLSRGQCVIPVEELAAHGLAAADFSAGEEAPAAAVTLLGDLLQRFHRDFIVHDRLLSRPPLARLLFCRIMVRMAAALCAEMQRAPESLLKERTALTPVRKLWIAWRTRFI